MIGFRRLIHPFSALVLVVLIPIKVDVMRAQTVWNSDPWQGHPWQATTNGEWLQYRWKFNGNIYGTVGCEVQLRRPSGPARKFDIEVTYVDMSGTPGKVFEADGLTIDQNGAYGTYSISLRSIQGCGTVTAVTAYDPE